jgi:hypothetical protein
MRKRSTFRGLKRKLWLVEIVDAKEALRAAARDFVGQELLARSSGATAALEESEARLIQAAEQYAYAKGTSDAMKLGLIPKQ